MASSRRIIDVPTYSDALVLACKMKLLGRSPTREDVARLLKSRTLFEEYQHAFDEINKKHMCLPWTVHEWIAEVANNPLVIDFVLDRFHTTTELDLTTGSRWPVLTPMKLETGPLKEPVIINAEWWRKHPNNPANKKIINEESEPKKEPETVEEEPEPKKRRKEPETTKEEPEPKKEPETVKEEPEPQQEFGFLIPMTFPTENPNFFTHPLGC